MRIHFGMSLLVGVLMAGCAGGGAIDDTQPELADDGDGKADVTRPRGSYENQAPEVGDLRALTLNADKTFSRQFQYVDCVPKAVCAPESGTYRFTRGGSTTYIRFYDGSGQDLGRYAYRLSGDALTLRADGDTHSFVMTKAASAQICGGIAGLSCPTGYECKLDGSYPDAGGTCVQKTDECGGCGDGKYCSFCFGRFACIPNGALC